MRKWNEQEITQRVPSGLWSCWRMTVVLGGSASGLFCVSRSPLGKPSPASLLQVSLGVRSGHLPDSAGWASSPLLGFVLESVTLPAGDTLHLWTRKVPIGVRGIRGLMVANQLMIL